MMTQRLLLLSVCLFSTFLCNSQVSPVFTQYIFDPYIINPSLIANSRKAELNLLYRQQWAGIEDGPQTIQGDFQYAANNRMTLGLNIVEDKTIILSNTMAMATFGYRVPISTEHILGFGLSGGVVSNRIRLEDIPNVDSNDPVILSAAANNIAFDSQFGVHYGYRNLTLGFSLMNLIERETFSVDELQGVKFNELRNKIIFASYKFDVSPSISIQPNFMYRFTADNTNYYEGSAIFSYNNFISVGGGYREEFGPMAIARVYVKDFQIGYAYDFPSEKASVSTGGTNEIQFKWRFGKELARLMKKPKPVKHKEEPVKQQVKEEPIKEEPIKEEPVKQEEVIKPNEKVEEVVVAPIVQQQVKEEPPQAKPVTYLLVAGAFESQANAQKLVSDLKKNGYDAEIIQLPGSSYYYVHIPKFSTDTRSLEKILEIRKLDPNFLKEAWYINSN